MSITNRSSTKNCEIKRFIKGTKAVRKIIVTEVIHMQKIDELLRNLLHQEFYEEEEEEDKDEDTDDDWDDDTDDDDDDDDDADDDEY